MSFPEINADRVTARKAEEERIAFMRQCAVSYFSSGKTLAAVNCASLARDWCELWDAIEATRAK